jgi:hypothetical protein
MNFMASATGWKQSGRTDAIRTESILDEGADAALRINAVRHHRKDYQKDDREDLEQRIVKDAEGHFRSRVDGSFRGSARAPACCFGDSPETRAGFANR